MSLIITKAAADHIEYLRGLASDLRGAASAIRIDDDDRALASLLDAARMVVEAQVRQHDEMVRREMGGGGSAGYVSNPLR